MMGIPDNGILEAVGTLVWYNSSEENTGNTGKKFQYPNNTK